MNVTVEAAVMTAVVSTPSVAVYVRQVICQVSTLVGTATSTVRSLLRMGRSSLSAVPGDTNLMNGATVLA